jgi:hypothetical protein
VADGSILDIDASQHSDLFLALKGGGNNFSIVTNVRLKIFQIQPLQTAIISFQWQHVVEIIATLISYNSGSHLDFATSVTISFTFDVGRGKFLAIAALTSTNKPLLRTILALFFEIPNVYIAQQTMNLSQVALLLDERNPKLLSFRGEELNYYRRKCSI